MDINSSIKDAFVAADDPSKLQIICDLEVVEPFLQPTVMKNITHGLDSNALQNTNFLF